MITPDKREAEVWRSNNREAQRQYNLLQSQILETVAIGKIRPRSRWERIALWFDNLQYRVRRWFR